ncbi:DNA gyrase subunit A [Enterobacter cloacae]|uniref:DNA gyrase subunit A n=1 Tax=Enterobacter cloacae TaxID=550 RepID=A0A377LVS4_ENTCL|nr:DNA gyrase subunit A [Enterobacter cloacae]
MRDESDKDGMRIVIEIKRDAVGEVVLNNCTLRPAAGLLRYQHGCTAPWSAEDHEPERDPERVCPSPREVVTRRTIFELRKAR